MRSSIYALAAITLLASTNVVASFISMATGFSVTEGPDGLTLNVNTKNQGDEPAYEIQFEVQVGDQTFTSISVPKLGVNEMTSTDLPIQDIFQMPGHYPVLIKTHYKDANRYPFTALSLGFYDFQYPVVSKVLVQAENTSIPSNGKGTMKYTVRNNDSVERDLVLTLYLPDELAAVKETDSLTIGPKQSQSLEYTIENFSALENSGYAVVLVTEYEDDKSHYSAAASGTVRITAPDNMTDYMPWIVLAVAVFIVALVFIVRSRRK